MYNIANNSESAIESILDREDSMNRGERDFHFRDYIYDSWRANTDTRKTVYERDFRRKERDGAKATHTLSPFAFVRPHVGKRRWNKQTSVDTLDAKPICHVKYVTENAHEIFIKLSFTFWPKTRTPAASFSMKKLCTRSKINVCARKKFERIYVISNFFLQPHIRQNSTQK